MADGVPSVELFLYKLLTELLNSACSILECSISDYDEYMMPSTVSVFAVPC